jgi:mRNA interferase RelE/StbE
MFKLDITKAAAKFIANLQAKQYHQVVSNILRLRENPEPHDSKQLKGSAEYRRSDIGEFRIIYRIKEDTVIIALVGKRNDNEVYKQFSRQKK